MRDVVERVLELVRDHYFMPDVADRVIEYVRAKDYSEISSPAELALTLTTHLREVSRDKHLAVVFNEQPQLEEPPRAWGPTDREDLRQKLALRNFGFEKVERLAGNVGYIDLRAVVPPDMGGEALAAAMQLVSHTCGLILDLRRNGGGTPTMVALICSYLLGPEPVHINSFESPDAPDVRQSWTHPHVSGPTFVDKPIMVLIGPHTFSGGEELAYVLKHHGRATLVGEMTAGAANVTQGYRVDDHFQVFVPFGRPVHPVTGTNWEGTGVEPDVHVPVDDALRAAHLEMLRRLVTSSDGPALSRALRAEASAALEAFESQRPPTRASGAT